MNNVLLAFVTGLTTGGLSCLAVQGGLLASSVAHEIEQSVQDQPTVGGKQQRPPVRAARPILLFLAAKVVAYTLLGFVLGMLGSVLQLTPTLRAILLAAIGIFMVGTALRMFNVHPIFRYFALEPPRAVTRFIRRKAKDDANALTPLFLGAFTVLIPCGVTQAMMAVAMGTGNPITGATIMLAFILGTSPVFFTVAYLATRLGARLEASFMRIVAVVVLVLGLFSIDTGLTLAGWPYSISNLRMALVVGRSGPAITTTQSAAASATPTAGLAGRAETPTPAQGVAQGSGSAGLASGPLAGPFPPAQPAVSSSGVVTITVGNNGYSPAVSHAQPNQPFRLALVTNKTTSCARAFVIQALGIEKVLPATGTVMLDVPAQRPGSKLFYSCSMGMYSGVIVFDG